MANPNVSELATTTIEGRSKKIQDNVTKSNAVLAQLSRKGRQRLFNGGTQINEEISYAANGNGQWYSGAEQLAVGSSDVLTTATYNLKQLAVAVTITGLEELQNTGEAAQIDLLAARLQVAEATMANMIAQGIYSDGTSFSSKTITGLDAAVPQDPTTGTYGGINRATSPTNLFWRSQLYDPSSTPTATTIQGYMNLLWASCVRGADRPDLIMSGATIWARTSRPSSCCSASATLRWASWASPPSSTWTRTWCWTAASAATRRPRTCTSSTPTTCTGGRTRTATCAPSARSAWPSTRTCHVEILGFAGNLTCSGAQFQGRLKGD
jgi:hypothetical protein